LASAARSRHIFVSAKCLPACFAHWQALQSRVTSAIRQ
jgi:hypothetical protein